MPTFNLGNKNCWPFKEKEVVPTLFMIKKKSLNACSSVFDALLDIKLGEFSIVTTFQSLSNRYSKFLPCL